MRPKDTATRRKRISEIQRCTELESLQRHPHEEANVPSKQAASRSVPDYKVSEEFLATAETPGEVESYSNDFDRYIDDQEKMFHDRDPQSSSSGTICGTPEILSWLDQQLIRGKGPCTNNFDHLLGFTSRAPVTSQSPHHQTLPEIPCQITADSTVPQSLPDPDINFLVDLLSSCSLRAKSFTKRNLKRYSAATTVTKTIPSRSEPSIASCQIEGTSESYDPTGFLQAENLVQKFEAIDHILPAAELRFIEMDEMESALISHWPRTPRDEEISPSSIFWYHMACEILLDPPQFCSAYPEGLCSSESPDLFQSWEPGTSDVIALQPVPVFFRDTWSGKRMPEWVDRFGNTSAHIAALCGASLSHLLCLMAHVDVNALNNAGQTFMHVLNPRWMSPEDMIELKNQLVREGFIFHHRDVAGQTFLDTLKHGGIKQSDFARCWLRPIIRKDKTFHGFSVEFTSEQLLDGRLVRKIFNEIGVHEEQWKMLGWASNSYQHLHCSSNVNELLEPSYSPMLLKTKDCWDRLGRGLLHIAADDIAGPATPTEVQQQRSNVMRLNLVKHLLSIGVDVNHHDDEGVTPLMAHVRCVTYQHAIVDELLQHGAEPNARDSSGHTALHIAIKLGNMDATKILLGRGANVHARNRICEGLLTVAKRVQRGAKDDVGLYAKITACMALIIDAGAIASPSLFHEWDTPQMNGSYNTPGSNSSRARPAFLDPVNWESE